MRINEFLKESKVNTKDQKPVVKENVSPLKNRMAELESAVKKSQEITKLIKYDDTIQQIISQISELAQQVGIDPSDLKFPIQDVHEAKQKLNAEVYNLEQVFHNAFLDVRNALDQEENDFSESSDGWSKQQVINYFVSRGKTAAQGASAYERGWTGPKKKAAPKKLSKKPEWLPYVDESTVDEDWQKTNKKDKTDGMSQKAVNAYRREHPGSKLKTAVTTKPSKLKKGSKASKRRKSFCARSNGQKKMHHIDCSKTPEKAICKARSRWNC